MFPTFKRVAGDSERVRHRQPGNYWNAELSKAGHPGRCKRRRSPARPVTHPAMRLALQESAPQTRTT